MDTKQIEYILKIAEENNITKASEKLYITQSALNQQLLKLERELGTPLFHRSRNHCRLTEAGQIYVDGAREILKIKNSTYNRLYDVSHAGKGVLTIGLTPGRGLRIFTAIYPELHRCMPNLSVRPVEMRVRDQQKALARGEIDLGFMTLCSQDRTGDEYVVLGSEEMVVIVPSGHPLAQKAAPPGMPLTVLDIQELRYEPFVLIENHSTFRTVCDTAFAQLGFTPDVLFETNNTASIVAMVESTFCCGTIPWYYVRTPSPRLACFRLPNHPSWDITVSYSKSSYLSLGAKTFINLAKLWWDKI
ncbi:MAG: LysR family transcriptional regulator [Eubacteriales bacterium]|nr:LysR family transcriptional regulator [Eubacteriales bacterium]